MPRKLSHLDATGRMRMVDVSSKRVTRRQAMARGRIYMHRATLDLILEDRAPKGDVMAAARLAGIMAAKRVDEIIPLAHPLPIEAVDVAFSVDRETSSVGIEARVRTRARTGVEMEALTAVMAAALTLYDMLKAVDRGMVMGEFALWEKRGGRSGASTAAAPKQLRYLEARDRVLEAAHELPTERLPLLDSRGRALRNAVTASHALPPFRNSSMDGYAVHAGDLTRATAAHPVELPVVLVLPAGNVAPLALARGEAMRIMTGAQVPEGTEAVVPFEDSTRVPGPAERVRFSAPAAMGANLREAGADLAAGAEALPRGRELSPHDLALLAALGIAEVEVGRRPRVAIFSTGDELLAVEDALRPGAIRDSNLPLLRALLAETGCEVVRSENVADDPAAVTRGVLEALELADLVLTVGGVSAGDFDPVKESLAGLGPVELWRVAMKPGRPQAFGTPRGRLFFGLPGNPGSVACVFEALVRPALRKMQGYGNLDRPRVVARATELLESRQGRTDFVRVTLEWQGESWWASPAGAQVSGHLTPQARAHALLVIPEAASALSPGDRAEAWVLRWPE